MTSEPTVESYALDANDPRGQLAGRVRDALRALPGYFSSVTNIVGVQATDLFTLNSVLGATIEVQVVETLNRIRRVWDPDDEWASHYFVRQPQTFPDVLLRGSTPDKPVVGLGIELKGWYLLSKESVPSFRYSVTPAACDRHDLLAVVPWFLSDVLSGRPQVGLPGVWSARFAAEYRNWWWQHGRSASTDTSIETPEGAEPYQPRHPNSDKPVSDSGGNFGRIARTGILADWIDETLDSSLAGIPARTWVDFFRHQATQPA